MVSTRRQNGVTPKPSSALKRSLEADEASGNEYNSEDDYEEPKVLKVPSAKRRKTTQAATSKASSSTVKAAVKPKRRGKDLSLLPTMPLDILYEILSQLGPRDLLSLSRTNKLWRRAVVNPETEFLWRDARKACQAPEPPEDFTEQRWAGLLFETTCESCGKKGTTPVDWLLLRRACVGCKRKHLMYGPKFRTVFPGEDKDVLDYVPHTNMGVSTRKWGWRAKDSKFYWDEDVERALDQMRTLHGKKLEEWEREATKDIEDRTKMVSTYEKWTQHLYKLDDDDVRANRQARLKAATQRFVEAGYELIDIEEAISTRSSGIHTGVPHITNAVWTKIRPHLEPYVVEKRNKRLAAELQPDVEKRMKILSDLYDGYLDRNFRPSERYYCPPVEVFRPIPDVMKLVEAEKGTTITAQDFEPIVGNFDQYIADYQEGKKNLFEEMVPQGKTNQHSFNLARNVFRRSGDGSYSSFYHFHYGKPEDNVLVGWSMVGTHWSSSHRKLEIRPGVHLDLPPRFGYNVGASASSSQLIVLAGLDPETATVEDMDAADPRFVHINFSTAIGYPVFTWRGAIAVSFILTGDCDTDCHFRLATSEEEAEAKANEDALRGTAKCWSCNHCTEFLDSHTADTRDIVLKHVQDKHGICDPKPLQDYFVNERCRHIFEKPCEILVPDVEKFMCNCASCGRCEYRAFSKDELDLHLKQAFPYSYSPPVAHIDYWPTPSGRDAKAPRLAAGAE